jgi:glycosyltransferase involved in cell wall biosynthesis
MSPVGAVPERVPVSVVMPCYRAANTVAAAVRSVREQTAPPLELIAVDDASDDETLQVLTQLQKSSPWLEVIRQPVNKGAASARNAGWARARGDLIAFLDADDTWHPRKLELQYAFMAAHPEIALCGHRSSGAERGEGFAEAAAPPRVTYPSPASFLLRNPFITPSVMLRRSVPQRFLEGRRHMEDHLLWTSIVLSGGRAAILEADLARVHKASYGEGGLSANLWEMEKGELDNYRQLHRAGFVSTPALLGWQAFSLLKFIKRLAVVAYRAVK